MAQVTPTITIGIRRWILYNVINRPMREVRDDNDTVMKDRNGEKMRKYEEIQKNELIEVVCNKCGRALKVENGVLKEGCFHGEAVFGYFSRKDGVKQSFDLCEDCYDAMIAEFKLKVQDGEVSELL